jgi:hypothetical protein
MQRILILISESINCFPLSLKPLPETCHVGAKQLTIDFGVFEQTWHNPQPGRQLAPASRRTNPIRQTTFDQTAHEKPLLSEVPTPGSSGSEYQRHSYKT